MVLTTVNTDQGGCRTAAERLCSDSAAGLQPLCCSFCRMLDILQDSAGFCSDSAATSYVLHPARYSRRAFKCSGTSAYSCGKCNRSIICKSDSNVKAWPSTCCSLRPAAGQQLAAAAAGHVLYCMHAQDQPCTTSLHYLADDECRNNYQNIIIQFSHSDTWHCMHWHG